MRAVFTILAMLAAAAAQAQPSAQQTGNTWNVTLQPEMTARSTVTATNECFKTHDFQTTFDIPFMKLIGPDRFTVPARQSRQFPVQFDTRGMKPGSYEGTVRVRCLDCSSEKGCKQDYTDLHVVLTVPAPTSPPENPPTTPGTRPPENPPPTTDDRNQTDCPQRGKGCVMLIVDFSKDYALEFDMSHLPKLGKDVSCDVDYVAPAFLEIPKAYTIMGHGMVKTFTPDPADVKRAEDHNQAEWDKINEAEKKHREKVSKGVEIAIEITNGHGGDALPGLPCGDVEPNDWRGSYLRRDDFHLGNYTAANKHVCSWFVGDFTCYGGLTPKAVDELNNLGTATCNKSSTVNCPIHAGWEADGAISSATSTDTCSNASVWWQSSYVKEALEAEVARRKNGQNKDYSELIKALHSGTTKSATARYADRGYAKDKPPSHARSGYGEKSCEGADCK